MNIFTTKSIRRLFICLSVCTAAGLLLGLPLLYFLPDKAALWIFLLFLLTDAGIWTACFRYFIRQNNTIMRANAQLSRCIAGDTDTRLEDMNEGELYKLFHKVNTLVSMLNAHAENELKAKESLKNVISDISHQLKTPIAALNIYTGLIQDEADDSPELQHLAALSEQEIDRIEILVQNLLKIAKLDAGTIVMNKADENVSELINDIYEQFSFRATQEGKEIILTGTGTITLFCDRVWLTEAIGNIVKNALDHTASGGRITIERKQFASVVQILVKDNGCGIHPEDLHHIFKRFYRSRFSQDTQGIGLGLPLAKTIIEAHNGTVEVDSEPGRGTIFTINFLNPTKL